MKCFEPLIESAIRSVCKRPPISATAVGVLILCFSPELGYAQSQSNQLTNPFQANPNGASTGQSAINESPWDVTIGGGLGIAPKYDGSAKYTPVPIPLVLIKYGDRIFLGTSGLGIGLGYNIIDTDHLQIGPIIGFNPGRRVELSPELRGLSTIQPSLTGGGFVDYNLGHFGFEGIVGQSITQSRNGLTGTVSVSYRERLFSPNVILKIAPEIKFANAQYETTWFGVTPYQSIRSGLRAYKPAGGIDDAGINLIVTWQYSDHIILSGFTEVHELVGNAGESPIVRDKTQISMGVGAAYHF